MNWRRFILAVKLGTEKFPEREGRRTSSVMVCSAIQYRQEHQMAAWRVKACSVFGFPPDKYSFRRGVVDLFTDLYDMALEAVRSGDEPLLRSIFDYSLWADRQASAGHLRSAADILFFMRLFEDTALLAAAAKYFPPELLAEKRDLLPSSSALVANLPARKQSS
jgi:hypothetical protein